MTTTASISDHPLAAALDRSSRPSPIETPRVPFTRLVHVELRKAVDTRSGLSMLVAIAGLTVAVVVGMWFAAPLEMQTFGGFLRGASNPAGMLLPLIGILAVTSEFGQRTGLTTFALEPNRTRVLGAKALSVVVLGSIVLLIGVAVATIAAALAGQFHDVPDVWGQLAAREAAGRVATLMLLLAAGLAMGLVFLNSPIAIVTFIVAPMILNTLGIVLDSVSRVIEWIDLGTATLPLTSESMTGQDWAHLAAAVTVWIVVPAAIGVWRVRRYEFR
ncbi:MAG: hypothetical protein CSA84_05350 [Actinomycetales bacterium]|nr:MAG: hypothetical protein CSA84_05350 [Actinomycetales bacterium]